MVVVVVVVVVGDEEGVTYSEQLNNTRKNYRPGKYLIRCR